MKKHKPNTHDGQRNNHGQLCTVTYCLSCGHRFYPTVHHFKIGWGKFCSRECRPSTLIGKTGEKHPAWVGDNLVLNRAKSVKRRRATSILNHAVEKLKIIKPEFCEACGSNYRIEGHHHDYDAPLDVIWLCQPCHKDLHKAQRREDA